MLSSHQAVKLSESSGFLFFFFLMRKQFPEKINEMAKKLSPRGPPGFTMRVSDSTKNKTFLLRVKYYILVP